MVEEFFPEFAKNRHVLPLDCFIAISDSETVPLKDLIKAWNSRSERNKVLDLVLEIVKKECKLPEEEPYRDELFLKITKLKKEL